MSGLNSQKRRFIESYLVSSNATKSAIDAGYSEATAYSIGSRLLKDAAVKEAIQQAQNDASERNRIKIDDVLNGLLSEAKDKGESSTSSARIAAWVHLGKHLGMFTNNGHQTSSTVKPPTRIELVAGEPIKIIREFVDSDGNEIEGLCRS
jgi:phage terminase small subunit